MAISKSSGIDALIRSNDDSEADNMEALVMPSKKRDRKPVKPQMSQAWRVLEDRLDDKRLQRKLKEYYE
ncbi:MAG: PA3496 family putative envelope integrity protein [Gammaproteobacteria bacterium]